MNGHPMVGRTLGHYRMLERIGAGGMGEVYRARDARLGREVAVKVLPERLAEDPMALKRFEREARALAALSHPHILTIYDVGTAEGISYLVMELLEGQTLRTRLAGGAILWPKVVELGVAIAQALTGAHAKGIIHRDLKPENLFLTADGRLKVLDFGLARADPVPGGPVPPPVIHQSQVATIEISPLQTTIGTIMGTIGYMAPEQVQGLRADARSDLFALGCVLYEMVSGRCPFAGVTTQEILAAIVSREPPALSAAVKEVPAELERVIRRCLDKSPDARFQSAQDLAFALQTILSDSDAASPVTTVHRPAKRRPRNSIGSLAVLPFGNASTSSEMEYLSDGITESLINQLSPLPRLRVMARSTVFRYKGSDVDAQEIGRRLNVRAVLTGRVLQRGNRLVIKAELVNVADGAQLWGEQYNRDLAEIFAIEEAIAHEIASRLRPRLTGDQKEQPRKSHTPNAEAYQIYLKGRYCWNKRTDQGLKMSIKLFEQASGQDPRFALPWAGLADAYHQLGIWGNLPPQDACPKAEAAARKALELEPTLAEAHASLGTIKREYTYDLAGAERDFQRAIELNPNYATAHHWYGECLGCMGRHTESIAELQHAQQLDPLSSIINAALARHGYFFARQYERAIDQCRKTLEMDPGFWVAHVYLGLTYARTGQFGEALAEFQAARRLDDNVESLAGLGLAYGLSGQRVEAENILHELEALSKQHYVMSIAPALVHAGLGEIDQAFAWLERAYEDRNGWLSEIKADPTFDSLRPDPRFTNLIHRMRLGA